jgi:hypothetical protein
VLESKTGQVPRIVFRFASKGAADTFHRESNEATTRRGIISMHI